MLLVHCENYESIVTHCYTLHRCMHADWHDNVYGADIMAEPLRETDSDGIADAAEIYKLTNGSHVDFKNGVLVYFWHVTRMEKDRYPNILMHGYTVTHGRRLRGRPRKRWLDKRLWSAEPNYSSGVTSRKRQSEMEKYCLQQGQPERGDIVFVAEALSQVS